MIDPVPMGNYAKKGGSTQDNTPLDGNSFGGSDDDYSSQSSALCQVSTIDETTCMEQGGLIRFRAWP